MQTLPAPRELILEQLERMLASDTFAGADRSRAFLRFLVEHAIDKRSDRLKEYTIGAEALGRGDAFDPRTDPIVRAEASRLRNRLERYYATDGVADTVVITVPKGSYVPQFQNRIIPEAAPVAATTGDRRSTSRRLQTLIWFVLGGIAVGAAVLLLVSMRTGPDQFPVDLSSADYSLGADFGNDVILSPDGTRIVFVALGPDHVQRLMTRSLSGQGRVVPLPDTDGARAPFFSPDGRWVCFWADAKIKMVSIDGGSPIELTDAATFGGGSWGNGEDGDIIIAAIDGVLKRVSLTSRQTTDIADLRKEGVVPSWPDLLPGGNHVLFTAVGPHGPDASNIEVLSLSDRTRKPVVRAGFGRYLRDGYLLYVNQGSLFAVPFDRERLTVQATGALVLDERVASSPIFGNAKFDIARNGTLIYRRSPMLVAAWLDRGGNTNPLSLEPGAYTFPRLSPNGERLAINVADGGVLRTEIYDLRQLQEPTRLPLTLGSMSTVWHPDGFLVLGSREGMSWLRTDDMSKLEMLTPSPTVQIPWSFTRDGTHLAYAATSRSFDLDLWTIPISHAAGKLTAGKPEPFLQTPYFESYPSFSPDGRWLAYGSGTQRNWGVYVRRFPRDDSLETKVSHAGGRIARWLRNGRELVYRTDDHRLMVVDYEVKNGTFIAGTPREWTPRRLADTGVIANFDADPDGARILGLVLAPGEDEHRIRNEATVRPHFFDEVRRRFAGSGR